MVAPPDSVLDAEYKEIYPLAAARPFGDCCGMTTPHSHRALFAITAETLILQLFGGSRAPRVFVPGTFIPQGAHFHGMQYDFASDCFLVRLEHPSFPAVEEGCQLPRIGGYAALCDMAYPLPTEPGVFP